MLRCFEEWNSKASLVKRYGHIDVALLKNDTKYYTIQVTNYGQYTDDVLSLSYKIFSDLVTVNTVFKNSLIATVHGRNEHRDCHETLNLHLKRNRLSLTETTNNKNLINFSYQKRYLSFVLENKLISSEIEKFTNVISEEIVSLQQLNSNIKFTIHVDKKIQYNNHIALDNDYKSCRILATALTNIIKQSLDVKFKENCFSALNVENSHQVETALMIKLLPLIHENYTFPKDT